MREKYEQAAQEIETPKQRARSSNGSKSRS
jgi:hypothetical protein